MIQPRGLNELIERREPAIELIRDWVKAAKNKVSILDVERAAGEHALLALQITSRSPMGAMALDTGGLLIDDGWIRVLGGGSSRLPRALHVWNGLVEGSTQRLPGTVLVGDDVLGGFFAVNGGGIKGMPGSVFYSSPESLSWGEVASSYSEWLTGLMDGDLDAFYEGLRWQNWGSEVVCLDSEHGISVYPFLCTDGATIDERSGKPVPVEELWRLHRELAAQFRAE